MSGEWIPFNPGVYKVCVWREKTINLGISLTRSDQEARNNIDAGLQLPD
jgi:hypothetical protein